MLLFVRQWKNVSAKSVRMSCCKSFYIQHMA
jgi:hypothetical protein